MLACVVVVSSSHLENEDMEVQWNHSPAQGHQCGCGSISCKSGLQSSSPMLGLPSELLHALHTWAGKGQLCSMGG